MNEFDQLPPDRDFGQDFSYAAWPKNTTVSLHNVPWSSDYRDVVKFANPVALDTYLRLPANAGPVIAGMSRATNVNVAVRIPVPFHQAYKYNYLRVVNEAQPIPGDGANVYYYFIQDVRYVAGNTTELVIMLDVWQTFNADVTFGNCYIERGHIGIANSRQMENNGRDFLAIPEGLDLGGEYMTVSNDREVLGRKGGPGDSMAYDILVTSTVSLGHSGGDVSNPVLNTAGGSDFEGLPNGAEVYWFPDVGSFQVYMAWAASRPWISQGIISIMAVPSLNLENIQYDEITYQDGLTPVRKLKGDSIKPRKVSLSLDWRNGIIPSRYAHLKKFYTYPYSAVELTMYSGSPLILKPESLEGNHVDVMVLMHLAMPSPRVVVYPLRYNASQYTGTELKNGAVYNDGAEFLDMVTGIFDLPTFSTVNNAYMNFMASNRNAMAYAQQSADWSQQRALSGAQMSYDQSTAAMSAATNQNEIGVNATNQTLGANLTAQGQRAMLSGGGSLVGGGMSGNMGGVASGAMSSVTTAMGASIDATQQVATTAIGVHASRAALTAGQLSQAYNRDTNKSYADWAAKGDYQNTIAGINARVQDAKLLQPSTSGQVGGDAFNLAMYEWAVHSKIKTIQGAAMASIGEYWLRYGYQVNRFGVLPSSLAVMEKFTYWKLRETYIRSAHIPESFKLAIRGIFEKGVTVWRNPNDIGFIDIGDNAPLGGITL